MRGHANGPFTATDPAQLNPVLRVQKQLKLLPNAIQTVQIVASETQPVLLKIVANVLVALTTGTNSLIVGNDSNDDAYLETGDTTLGSTGFNTEKRFLLTATVNLIANLTSAAIAAAKALTISAITAANTQTVSIGGQVYTFNTLLTDTANNVLIGADATAMGANLAAAINGGAGAGTLYGTGTVANASVTAVAALGIVTVTARTAGTAGNSIVLAETLTNSAWAGGATALSGGQAAFTDGEVWLFIDA